MASSAQFVKGATNAFAQVTDGSRNLLRTSKPWKEFFAVASVSRPASIGDATSRLRKNISYFGTNYLVTLLLVLAAFFVTKPSSLIWIALVASLWVYVLVISPGTTIISGRPVSHLQKVIAVAAITAVIVFYFSSLGTLSLYGLLSGTGIIAIHGVMRTPENLFDDATGPSLESQASSLFKSVRKALSEGPGAAAPTVEPVGV